MYIHIYIIMYNMEIHGIQLGIYSSMFFHWKHKQDEKALEEDVFETDYDFRHRIGQNRAKHRARRRDSAWRCGWGIHWRPTKCRFSKHQTMEISWFH